MKLAIAIWAIAIVGCGPTPKQCAEVCHELKMAPVFVPIAGDPHACDCKLPGNP